MSEPSPNTPGQILAGIARMLTMPVCFLVPAGTFWWPQAWLLSGIYIAWALMMWAMLSRHDPELLQERMKRSPVQEGQAGWDRFLLVGVMVAGLALLIVPGLDAVRFGWSTLPRWVVVAGFAVQLPAMALITWVQYTNSFAAPVVKLDEARGQHVVTTGPYAFVRHPMYSAVILMVFGLPMALGSAWGLVPAAVMNLLMVLRTVLEDRELHAGLEGYVEYAKQTRYRLVPGVW